MIEQYFDGRIPKIDVHWSDTSGDLRRQMDLGIELQKFAIESMTASRTRSRNSSFPGCLRRHGHGQPNRISIYASVSLGLQGLLSRPNVYDLQAILYTSC